MASTNTFRCDRCQQEKPKGGELKFPPGMLDEQKWKDRNNVLEFCSDCSDKVHQAALKDIEAGDVPEATDKPDKSEATKHSKEHNEKRPSR